MKSKSSMTKLAAFVTFGVLFIIGCPQLAHACSCPSPRGSDKSIEDIRNEKRSFYLTEFKGAAFTGTVLKVDELDDNGTEFLKSKKITVKVEKFWFGVEDQVVTVYTGSNDGDCGVSFKEGRKYFFVPWLRNGTLHSGLCDYELETDTGVDDRTAKEFSIIMGEPNDAELLRPSTH